jgi:predicted nucleic acid-binding protein
MKDKIFVDTNIIIYAYSKTDIIKNKIANETIFLNYKPLISTQVVNEVANILFKKFKIEVDDIENVLLEISDIFKIVNFSLTTQIKALKI